MSIINSKDTICALATPAGGAIGIVRVSGEKAISAVDALLHTNGKPLTERSGYSLTYGTIYTTKGEALDDVVVSLFRAPHSYTGEDSVEISCHGSRYILNKVLEQLVLVGCRMARAGEFSQRAFLNGKMDLSQAEAVADLIASTNKATHQLAMSQLRGGISSELSRLREQLLRLTSLLELELDFSDHEDLEFADRTELLELAQKIDAHITHLAQTFETGQALKQGIPVAIVGKTNVGKSTLLNQLIGDDRAIVSDIHGTTRDTIEETMEINGVLFRFIDTAGIRNTSEEVEKMGIERTLQKIREARIIIWLLDRRPTREEDDAMMPLLKGKRYICVHNKADLVNMKTFVPYFVPLSLISAKYGTGIENLKRRIYEEAQVDGLIGRDDIIVTNARHYEALTHAHTNLQRVLDGLTTSLTGDLIAEDLRLVLADLAEITGGAITSQETLNNVFSHFCVGK